MNELGKVPLLRIQSALFILSTSIAITGCTGASMLMSTGIQANGVRGTALRGKVHGGQQPVVGASVYLYAANTTGNAGPGVAASSSNASVSLLGAPGYVTTDSSGNFSITGDYTCPSADSQVYIYSVGGNPGAGTNSAAGLLAGLGSCGTLLSEGASFPFITVNEVSTIATAYSIAGYATDATHVSSSGSTLALTGISNAFATIANLETLSTGSAIMTTSAGNGAVPQSKVNFLADILAACVNTAGPTSTGCSTVLGNAKNGSTAASETATAAINIAHDPGNFENLYGVPTPDSPFQPISGLISDFTLSITYTGAGLYDPNGSLYYPEGIAVDASGNVWVANSPRVLGTNNIVELNPTGAPISGNTGFMGGGLNTPFGIAIAPSGNIWVVNGGAALLSEFSSGGSPIGSAGYSGGGLGEPSSGGGTSVIAIDASGDPWVVSGSGEDGTLSEFSANGAPVSGSSGYTGGGLYSPVQIAVDTSGDAWVTDPIVNSGSIAEFSQSGSAVSGFTGFTGGGLLGPDDIAIDGSGNVWVTDGRNNSVSEFSSSGSALSGLDGYDGGGYLDGPGQIAIDSAAHIWVASGQWVNELNSAGNEITGSGGYGYYDDVVFDPNEMAIDGSGNLWISNSNSQLVEMIGVASPVVTPIAANLKSPYGQNAVNRP